MEQVIDLVSTMTVPLACKVVGVPASTFRDWVKQAETAVAVRYASARSTYVESLVSEMLAIADEDIPKDVYGKTDNALVQQARVRIDTRKWLASKLLPKRYGDRLTVAGDEDNPVVIHKIERKVIDTTFEEETSDDEG